MAHKDLPAQAVLRQLLDYNSDTGVLTWLPRPIGMFSSGAAWKTWNKRFAGREAFTALSDGYRQGTVNGRHQKAHWVIWRMVYGDTRPVNIDHHNGQRADNRLSNLRAATKAQNLWNRGPSKNNASGHKGITLDRRRETWNVEVKAMDVRFRKSGFQTIEAAIEARDAAMTTLHGNFAQTG